MRKLCCLFGLQTPSGCRDCVHTWRHALCNNLFTSDPLQEDVRGIHDTHSSNITLKVGCIDKAYHLKLQKCRQMFSHTGFLQESHLVGAHGGVRLHGAEAAGLYSVAFPPSTGSLNQCLQPSHLNSSDCQNMFLSVLALQSRSRNWNLCFSEGCFIRMTPVAKRERGKRITFISCLMEKSRRFSLAPLQHSTLSVCVLFKPCAAFSIDYSD